MAIGAGIGTGAKVAGLVVATVVTAVGGAALWQSTRAPDALPQSQAPVQPDDTAAPTPATDAPGVPPDKGVVVGDTGGNGPAAVDPVAPGTDAAGAVPDPVVPAPPVLDLWRMDARGAVLVAGQAQAGAEVIVLIDTAEVVRVPVTGRGEFVANFDLPPGQGPRLMTLVLSAPGGVRVPSAAPVVLLPLPEPAATVVASVDPVTPTGTEAVPADAALPGITVTKDIAVVSDPGDGATVPEPAVPEPPLPEPPSPKPPSPEPGPASVGGPDPVAPVAAPPVDAGASAPVVAAATPLPPAALQITADGVRVLTPTAAGVAVPLTIDAISYDAAGRVLLGGRGAAGQEVRLYLDNRALAQMRVGADGGWGGVLPDVAPGRYVLRADQIGADDRVTARFETPFQRETPQTLAAAAAPAPDVPQVTPDPVAAPLSADAVAQGMPADPAPDVAPPEPATPPRTAVAGTAAPEAPTAAPAPAAASPATPAPATPAPATPAPAFALPPAQPATRAPVSVTVQPGFTLWAIAQGQYGDGVLYVQVFQANRERIRDPDLIYPGQVFALPAVP